MDEETSSPQTVEAPSTPDTSAPAEVQTAPEADPVEVNTASVDAPADQGLIPLGEPVTPDSTPPSAPVEVETPPDEAAAIAVADEQDITIVRSDDGGFTRNVDNARTQ